MSTLLTSKPDEEHSIAEDLVRRIALGDRAAESELVERYSQGLLYMLRRLSRSLELAEDLHQETFRAVLERLRRRGLDEPKKLAEFLRAVARNLFHLELRRQLRHPAEHLETADAPTAATDQPLGRILNEERSQIVRQLIAELSTDRDRQLLYRFYIAEEEKETICVELGLDNQHFKRVLFRARQRFKELKERFEKRQRFQATASHLLFFGLTTFVSLVLTWSPRAARASAVLPFLEPGVAIERQMVGGTSDVFRIPPVREGPWLVRVEQIGIDVVVEASSGAGATLGPVDTPTYRLDAETLLLPTDFVILPDERQITVRSLSSTVGPGRYTIELRELPDTTSTDRERLAAERAMSAAGILNFRAEHPEGSSRSSSELRYTAIASYEEALSRWRILGKRDEEARSLFALAVLAVKAGHPKRALELYAASLELWRALDDRASTAQTLSEMGLTHWRSSDSKKAEERLREAFFLYKDLGDRYGQAIVQNNLCLQAHAKGNLRMAKSCYQTALELLRGLGELGEESVLLSNLGSVNRNLGEPDKALEHQRQSLKLRRQAGDRAGEGRSLNNLAVLYFDTGETQAALSHYDQALEIFHQTGQRGWEARALNNLGVAYLDLGDLQRALVFLRQALDMRRAVVDRRGEIVTLDHLGHVRRRLGEYPAALAHHQQALALARQLGNRREETQALKSLGRIHLALGEFSAAYESCETALRLLKAMDDRPRLADLLLLKGEIETSMDRLAQARVTLDRSLMLHRQVGDQPGEARALRALARVARGLGRTEVARALLEEALAVIESIRLGVVSPKLRAAVLSSYRETYELLIDTLMSLHSAEPLAGWERAALEVSERSRARALLELLEEEGSDRQGYVDPGLLSRRRSLARRLSAKIARQIELFSSENSEEERAIVTAERFGLTTQLENLEAALRSTSPVAASPARTLRTDEIQALLDPDTWLLEYVLGEPRSFLWRVTATQASCFELPGKSEIEATARRVYLAFSTIDPRADPSEGGAAVELGRMLLGPIADELTSQRLVIVADGVLHYIPFVALSLPRGDGMETVLERHEITYLPSASALAKQRRSTASHAPGKWLAVLGDPVFDRYDPRISSGGTQPSSEPAVRAHRGGGLTELARLPSTGREARAIAALAPAGEVLIALGLDADRARVLGGELRDYRIVHFATHGLVHALDPELSGLVFSLVDEAGQPQDGFLSLHDISSLDLGAELVVLSGCETALGAEVRGEGLWGLTRGFLHIGVPRVVASLWRIEDEATAELMVRFYRGLRVSGLAPGAALRQAQLELRRQRRWRDPYFWAAFVLQGDWR